MIRELLKTAKDYFTKKSEKTTKYDQIASEVRNLLKATGATFIPKLCYALKEDWYPDRTEMEIQNNKDAREEIKDKIIRDWSKEYHHEGVWKESMIEWSFPKWLKDPDHQQRRKADWEVRREKEKRKFFIQIEEQKIDKKLDYLAKVSPAAPKEPEPETGPTLDVGESSLQPLGEDNTIPFLSMGEVNSAQYRLWNALTNKEQWPGIHDDILRDHVKPTREFRNRLIHELEPHEQNGIAHRCECLVAVLQDTIQSIALLQHKK